MFNTLFLQKRNSQQKRSHNSKVCFPSLSIFQFFNKPHKLNKIMLANFDRSVLEQYNKLLSILLQIHKQERTSSRLFLFI